MSYDNACKYLAEQYPQAFVRWLLKKDPQSLQILKTELVDEPIRADALLWLKIGEMVLHLEFQTNPQSYPPLPLRMLDYYVHLKRQYQCQVEQVVIFLKKTTSPTAFIDEYRDENTYHKYRVVRLWEQEAEPFLEELALLPLATLAKSNEPEKLLRNVAQKIREIPEKSTQKQISGCTEILAGIRFTEPLIRSLFREEIMKESVIYQSIHRQAREEGLQEGLQQGLQDEALRLVLRQLTIVLGEIAPESKAKIEGLSQERLENLAEALLAFKSQKDLENWLLVLGS